MQTCTEPHRYERVGWLRAAVLGANDGIVSTASLMIGVAAAGAARGEIFLAGIAGLAAGAMSMAAGEYVSVSSQSDTERADRQIEQRELEMQPEAELEELTRIYVQRGLDRELARRVAERFHQVDPLGTHLRDELGMSEATEARPWQAAVVSAASFAIGAGLPIVTMLAVAAGLRIGVIAVTSLVLLAVLGATGAYLGGAPAGRAALRVTVGGGLAMMVTALIGNLIGTGVG